MTQFLTAFGFLVFLSACASLPKGAPDILYQASYEVDQAHEENVDKFFPRRIAYAENQLEVAKEKYSQWRSQTADGRYVANTAPLEASKSAARSAYESAKAARDSHRKVSSWDNELTRREPETEELYLLTLTEPVAYFEKNKAKLDQLDRLQIESISETLKAHPEMKVFLTGYTDPRGSTKHNRELAKRRVHRVAAVLRKSGVPARQISLEAFGEIGKTSKRDQVISQKRRVDATLWSGVLAE